MNRVLAVAVCVTGYLGSRELLYYFMPGDTPLDSWGDWGQFALLLVLVFLPVWACVLTAVERLWNLEEVK